MKHTTAYILDDAPPTAFVAHPTVRGAWMKVHPSVALVACPACGSQPGVPCRSDHGYTSSSHFRRNGDLRIPKVVLDRTPAFVIDVATAEILDTQEGEAVPPKAIATTSPTRPFKPGDRVRYRDPLDTSDFIAILGARAAGGWRLQGVEGLWLETFLTHYVDSRYQKASENASVPGNRVEGTVENEGDPT